jgi:hypothetical protein
MRIEKIEKRAPQQHGETVEELLDRLGLGCLKKTLKGLKVSGMLSWIGGKRLSGDGDAKNTQLIKFSATLRPLFFETRATFPITLKAYWAICIKSAIVIRWQLRSNRIKTR